MLRPNKAFSLSLQRRDVEILRSLLESRVTTVAHASVLHFEGRSEAAKKRIQKLKGAGFLLDVKCAFHAALANYPTHSLVEFCTWPLLYQFKATVSRGREVTVKPDGFIRISGKQRRGSFRNNRYSSK